LNLSDIGSNGKVFFNEKYSYFDDMSIDRT